MDVDGATRKRSEVRPDPAPGRTRPAAPGRRPTPPGLPDRLVARTHRWESRHGPGAATGRHERAATSSARIPGRLAITSAASTAGRRPSDDRVEDRLEVRATTARRGCRGASAQAKVTRADAGRDAHHRADPAGLGQRPRAPTSSSCGCTTQVRPIPRLKVRTISSSAMSPRSWIRLEMSGTGHDPSSTATPRPGGQGPRDVVDPAAAGDVRKGQARRRPHRAARDAGSGSRRGRTDAAPAARPRSSAPARVPVRDQSPR